MGLTSSVGPLLATATLPEHGADIEFATQPAERRTRWHGVHADQPAHGAGALAQPHVVAKIRRVDRTSAKPEPSHQGGGQVANRARRGPVVLVNGLPGSGKTTLARALARCLALPLISKDVIKEAHADVFGQLPPDERSQRSWNSMFGAAAMGTMWALLADWPCGAVLESTWPAQETWEYVVSGLKLAGVDRPLQIWCEVSADLARQRFDERQPRRHPIHGDPPDDSEWQRWACARALPISDTLRVNTAGAVDWDSIAGWIECVTASSGGAVRLPESERPAGEFGGGKQS
jgi:predicted kinase